MNSGHASALLSRGTKISVPTGHNLDDVLWRSDIECYSKFNFRLLQPIRFQTSGMTTTILAIARPIAAEGIPAWTWLLLIAAGVVASVTDLRHTRIPNWLTLPLLGGGLLYAVLHGGLAGLGQAAAGAGVAGFAMIIGYIMFGGGAGDAKLMMALGAWLGIDASIILTLAVTIAGFIQAMAAVISRGGLKDVPLTILHSFGMVHFVAKQALRGKFIGPAESEETSENTIHRPRPKGWIPYAPSILTGTIVAWWYWEYFGALR